MRMDERTWVEDVDGRNGRCYALRARRTVGSHFTPSNAHQLCGSWTLRLLAGGGTTCLHGWTTFQLPHRFLPTAAPHQTFYHHLPPSLPADYYLDQLNRPTVTNGRLDGGWTIIPRFPLPAPANTTATAFCFRRSPTPHHRPHHRTRRAPAFGLRFLAHLPAPYRCHRLNHHRTTRVRFGSW